MSGPAAPITGHRISTASRPTLLVNCASDPLVCISKRDIISTLSMRWLPESAGACQIVDVRYILRNYLEIQLTRASNSFKMTRSLLHLGVPDELWERIEPIILEQDPPKTRGRKPADPRQLLNGIIFRLRSGCQWNRLAKELGDDSTRHRTFNAGWRWESCVGSGGS